MISQHFDKDNLHHAYLIEGAETDVLDSLLQFLEDAGIKTRGNSDFIHLHIDAFKMEDARNLKAHEKERGFSDSKKIFVISANSILLEAQNALLKVFEEPIPNTHFFVIVPDINSLIRTLVSRFYVIKAAPTPKGVGVPTASVGEKFLSMSRAQRLEFIKEMIQEPEASTLEEVGVPTVSVDKDLDSVRAKSLKFLNTLELALHNKLLARNLPPKSFGHFFKVREILRIPGSSVKNLMESVALVVPVIQ